MTRPTNEQPERDGQPTPFVVRGQVRQLDGKPLAGVVVRAFDRDLPSLQRREQRDDEPLGEAVTDERGNYAITYTAERFRRAEKGSADLVVRVFDREDGDGARILAESRTLFNAPADATLPPLIMDGRQPEPPAVSEYEQLTATLAPVLRGLSPADLTEEDISFLVGETGIERRRIELLREADRRHRETREAAVPTVVFYGLARQGLPLALPQLLAVEPAVLRRALEQAIVANIIPARLRESLDTLMRQLDQVRDAYLFPVTYAVTGRLLNQANAAPLDGFTVRALDLDATAEFATIRPVSSDDDGLFTLAYSVPRPIEPEDGNADGTRLHLRLTILDRQDTQLDEQELRVDPDQQEPFVVRVAVPQASSPTVAELTSVLHRELPSELSAFLEARGLHTLLDIRRAGGLRHLDGLPVDAHHPAVLALEAHADLNRLSPDLRVNADLNARGYNSVAEIARAPRRDVVAAIRDRVGDYKAAELHVMAQAQDAYLQNVLTDMRVELANGRLIGPARRRIGRERPEVLLSPTHQLFAEATGSDELVDAVEPSCDCDDCETAVSPLAYLADLLNYAVTHLKLVTGNLPEEKKISFAYLTETFHQPFGDLPATCDAMDAQVRQVRICCEVLRSYLGAPLAEDEQKKYVDTAYHTLLTQLGTSSAEIRLARSADEQTRVALGDRLGIDLRSDDVWKSRLDDLAARTAGPQSTLAEGLTEQVLEELFGLVDTQRDPLSTGVKRGDDGQQITRWMFYGDPWNSTADGGVRWSSNTDRDGLIYVRLRHDSAYHVELYRDAARSQLVAKGERSSAQGPVELAEENESGLSGRFEIAYSADSDAITIAALPKLLSWRLAQLRTIWRDQDRPPDVYAPEAIAPLTAEELLPIVDPDLIGPDDLRRPYPGSLAFGLWQNRRAQVDIWLDDLLTLLKAKLDLASSSPPPDAIFALFERMTQPIADTQLIPWNPTAPDAAPWWPMEFDPDTQTPDPFDMLHDQVTQTANKEQARKATDIIQKQLHLTVDSFGRLMTIRDTYYAFLRNPKSQPVTDDEWREVASILVQAQKVVLFPSWRQEEQEREAIFRAVQFPQPYALFGPQEFWLAQRESIEETATELWPPADRWPMPDDEPLGPRIDPELIGQDALPEQTVGQWARVLWSERREQLDAITKDLKAQHEQPNGFRAMLVQALADLDNSSVPNENDPWLADTKLYDLLQRLNGTNETERLAAEQDIQEQFHLSADNFKRLMAIKEKTETPGLTPTPSEWGEVDSILTSAQKKKRLFPGWLEEERAAGWLPNEQDSEHLSNYWQALKARLPRWRASVEARLAWQQALRARMAAPIVDPDVITYEDLKKPTDKPTGVNPAFELWKNRKAWLDDQNENVASVPIALAEFDAALLATLFGDTAQEQFATELVEVQKVSGWDSALKFVWGSPLPSLATALADRHSADEQKREAATKALDAVQADLDGADSQKTADATRIIAESLLLTPEEFKAIVQLALDLDAATAPDVTNLLTRIGLLRRAIGLHWNRSMGRGIAGQLDQLQLPYDAFAYLVGIRRLLLAGETVNVDEWGDVAAILVQVRKRRAAAAWRDRERQEGVMLGPDYFRIPTPPEISFPPPKPREYLAWRATRRDFQDWQDTLQMRIDQQQTVYDSMREAVGATEEATLPQLRDSLVEATPILLSAIPNLAIQAKWVTDNLLIDASESGCQITTRISQAIETIQGLLWSVRTGLLNDTDIYPKLQLRRAEFDQEWKWIGSYATWRAAMFVFLYPENIITPSLRRPEQQTPVFREIVDELRGNRQLTAEKACEAVQKYVDYTANIRNMRVQATCFAVTLKTKGTTCQDQVDIVRVPLFYMFGQGQRTNTIYWSAYDSELQSNSDYAQTFWEAIPALGTNAPSIVGAVPYETINHRKFIFLFARTSKQGAEKLVYVKYDLEMHTWDAEPTELDLPSNEGQTIGNAQNSNTTAQNQAIFTFTAVVEQRADAKKPPHVAVQLPSGIICDRKLSADGSGWGDDQWRVLVKADQGKQFSDLLAMITNMPEGGFFLFVSDMKKHLRYQQFDSVSAEDGTQPYIKSTSNPTVCSWGKRRLDVFVRGSDNALWHRALDMEDDNNWTDWESLGAGQEIASDPVAVSWGQGRIDVFALGSDEKLKYRVYDGAQDEWRPWDVEKFQDKGPFTSPPSVCSWGSGRLDLVIRDKKNKLWHGWLENNNWKWDLGNDDNPVTSDPVILSWRLNRIDILVQRTGQELWHVAWDALKSDGWYKWEELHDSVSSRPSVCSWHAGHLDIYVRSAENSSLLNGRVDRASLIAQMDAMNAGAIEHNTGVYAGDTILIGSLSQNEWHGQLNQPVNIVLDGVRVLSWDSIGPDVQRGPTAVSWGDGRTDVFVVRSNQQLYHKAYDSTTPPEDHWQLWKSKGGTIESDPIVVSWDKERIDVFAMGYTSTIGEPNRPELLHLSYEFGNWSEWESLGRRLQSGTAEWLDLGEGDWLGGLCWDTGVSAFWWDAVGNVQHSSLTGNGVATQTLDSSELDRIAVHSGSNPNPGETLIAYVNSKQGAWCISVLNKEGAEKADFLTRVAPFLNQLITLPMRLSDAERQARHATITQAFADNAGEPRSNITYLEEAYYFIPMHLALQLQACGQYVAALDLFRLVYDYAAPLQQRTLYGLAKETPGSNDLYERSTTWLLDPLNPHAIAETRPSTYTRFTLLSLIRCLLEYADAEFTLDTAESVPRARTLYLTALELLDSAELKRRVASCEDLMLHIDVGDPELLRLVDEVRRTVSTYGGLVERAEALRVAGGALALDIPVADRLALARERLRQHLPPKPSPKTMMALLDWSTTQQETAQRALVAQPILIEGALAAAIVAKHDFRRAVSLISGASAERLEREPIILTWLAEQPATEIQYATL